MDDGSVSEVQSGPPVSSQGVTGASSHHHGRNLIGLGGLLFLVIIFGIILIVRSHPKANNSSNVCTDKSNKYILTQDAHAIMANSLNAQQSLANKVKKIPGYQHDPNCLYVVTMYYITNGDAQNANTYFNKLKSVYSPSIGFSSDLEQPQTLSDLKRDISVAEANAQADQSNGYLISPAGVRKQ